MKHDSMIQKMGMCAALVCAVAACNQDELIDQRAADRIRFGVSAAAGADGAPATRSPRYADAPLVLLEKNGGDTLYLHASVESNLSTISAPQAATRGVPVHNAEDFATVSKSFSVTAYTDAGAPFMSNEEISVHSGNVWSLSGERYWPDDNSYLCFYAHAPYSIPQEGESNLAPTCSEGTISFDYTVPVSSDGTADAVAQPDILFAYARSNKSDAESNGGHVPLKFYHALAAVKFVTKDIAKCTINSITLKGLQGEGSCVFDGESGTFKWTLPAAGETTEFTQTFDVEVQDQQREKQDITDEAKETTFMMIPQSLSNATVEIRLTTGDGNKHTLTGKLAGTGEDQQAWEAGRIYTYAISTESINWTYVFEVTPSLTFSLMEGTTKTYNVTSYRMRTNNHSIVESVAWTAENVSAKMTDKKDGSITDIKDDLDDIVQFTNEDEGFANDPKSYNFTIAGNTMHTTCIADVSLKTSEPKGSEQAPFDLSIDPNGQISTANCYVVNAPGVYKLPLVYGNAIKGGSDNTSAYNNEFRDYLNQPIEDPYIYKNHGYKPDDCTLVWSDGFFMFKDVKLRNEGDKQYLQFTLDKDFMQQANAVVAVRDAQDRIMWSWHIWVTERNFEGPNTKEIHQLDDWYDTQYHYGMMSCNLGWVDGKTVYYNQRDLTYQFTQTKSNNKKTMLVEQTGYEFEYKDVGSTYYQWGRKDPLVALKNWQNVRYEDYRLHETGVGADGGHYVYSYQQGRVGFDDAIQHPNIFYTRDGNNYTNWLDEDISSLWNNSSTNTDEQTMTSVKTIYDPSPRGFKVPIPRAFAVFVEGGKGDGWGLGIEVNPKDNGKLHGYIPTEEEGNVLHNQYRVFPTKSYDKNEKEKALPLTATGQRCDRDGLEAYLPGDGKGEVGGLWSMYGVYYWTCNQKTEVAGYSFVLRDDYEENGVRGWYTFSMNFTGAKTMARPVRCIVE